MSVAQKMLKTSQHHKYKISCLIVKGGNLISVGINKDSAPKRFYKKHRPEMKLHSEVDAILGLDKSVTKGSTAYIAGCTTAGNPMISRPCTTCKSVLDYMKVRRIVYQDMRDIKEWKTI
jgi:deoxycytidylate deaminase